MLVLSRKSQESVVVGGSDGRERMLKVTVLEISGKHVRLGFEAPADVAVHRWELWERIQANGWVADPEEARTAPAISEAPSSETKVAKQRGPQRRRRTT